MALSRAGALTEKLVLSTADCIPIPEGMTTEAAASFIVSYSTALYGLSVCGSVHAGETVLVLGASGGVGIAAIDVAKALKHE
jgi:NADPH:quinone reductase